MVYPENHSKNKHIEEEAKTATENRQNRRANELVPKREQEAVE